MVQLDIFSLFVLFATIMGVSLLAWAVPVRLWIEAMAAGVRIGIGYLVGMRLRKVSPPAVVRPLIWATKAGIQLNVNDLEAHYLAGGQVERVVRALISADKASIELTFQQAAAIDLAGRDVFEAVQVSVIPKVINTPKVAAMAKDGINAVSIRVDGGMTKNDWLLQYLANILDIRVDRPVIMETTALGAAYLAGLGAGIFGSLDDIARNWQQGSCFKPEITPVERRRCLAGWRAAVDRTLNRQET